MNQFISNLPFVARPMATIKLGFEIALLCLLMIHQSNFALMQGLAWVGMLSSYSQEEVTFSEAVEQTFNGQKPCDLCHMIQDAQTEESEKTGELPGQKKQKDQQVKGPFQNYLAIKTVGLMSNLDLQIHVSKESNLTSQWIHEVSLPPPRV